MGIVPPVVTGLKNLLVLYHSNFALHINILTRILNTKLKNQLSTTTNGMLNPDSE